MKPQASKTPIPTILPVPEGTDRPMWSVMIPNYNAGAYLAQALGSVLQQAPGPEQMQIEVVDDCSTLGDPESVVQRVGGGRVTFFRQPRNVGAIGNFNCSLARSRGRLVHLLHADDGVRDGFYSSFQQYFESNGDLEAAFCRALIIDGKGRWTSFEGGPPGAAGTARLEGAFIALIEGNFIPAASVVARRDVYERLGGFDPSLPHTADWDMWQRIARNGPIGYIDEPLHLRREYEAADTNRLARSAANIAEIVHTIRRALECIPDPRVRAGVRRRSFSAYSDYALSWRFRFQTLGQHEAALRHAVWAFRLRRSLRNAIRLLVSAGRAVINLPAHPPHSLGSGH